MPPETARMQKKKFPLGNFFATGEKLCFSDDLCLGFACHGREKFLYASFYSLKI